MQAKTLATALRLKLGAGSVLLALTALHSPAALAQAIDADDFGSKLKQSLSSTNEGFDYAEAVSEGDRVLLRDATLPTGDDERLELGTLTFEGVEPASDGGYTARSVSVPDIDRTEDGTRVRVTGISASELEIPGDADGDLMDNTLFYQQARTGPVTVSIEDGTVFELSEIVVDVAPKADDSGFDSMVRAEGMMIDLSAVEDAKAREALEAFGYERLTGRMNMTAGWNVADGELDLSDYAVTLDDVGKLSIAINFSGYTEEVMQAMQQTQAQAATGTNEQAAGMAMFGILQQLDFNSATIRFEDDGVTAKALDYTGSQQGIDGTQMAAAIKGMLPLFLGQLQNPAFQTQVSNAVNAFLDDPQSLTITARPENAVSFATIMGAGMGAPQTLPDVLDVTVSANN
jgi:hypothetical protein